MENNSNPTPSQIQSRLVSIAEQYHMITRPGPSGDAKRHQLISAASKLMGCNVDDAMIALENYEGPPAATPTGTDLNSQAVQDNISKARTMLIELELLLENISRQDRQDATPETLRVTSSSAAQLTQIRHELFRVQ